MIESREENDWPVGWARAASILAYKDERKWVRMYVRLGVVKSSGTSGGRAEEAGLNADWLVSAAEVGFLLGGARASWTRTRLTGSDLEREAALRFERTCAVAVVFLAVDGAVSGGVVVVLGGIRAVADDCCVPSIASLFGDMSDGADGVTCVAVATSGADLRSGAALIADFTGFAIDSLTEEAGVLLVESFGIAVLDIEDSAGECGCGPAAETELACPQESMPKGGVAWCFTRTAVGTSGALEDLVIAGAAFELSICSVMTADSGCLAASKAEIGFGTLADLVFPVLFPPFFAFTATCSWIFAPPSPYCLLLLFPELPLVVLVVPEA